MTPTIDPPPTDITDHVQDQTIYADQHQLKDIYEDAFDVVDNGTGDQIPDALNIPSSAPNLMRG